MNQQARAALEIASEEFDRLAASCETQADLFRQAAEFARRGEVFEATRARERVSPLLRGMSAAIATANQLLKSIEGRDPDLWRRESDKADLSLVDQLSGDDLRAFARLHQAVCQDRSCPVMGAIADAIKTGR